MEVDSWFSSTIMVTRKRWWDYLGQPLSIGLAVVYFSWKSRMAISNHWNDITDARKQNTISIFFGTGWEFFHLVNSVYLSLWDDMNMSFKLDWFSSWMIGSFPSILPIIFTVNNTACAQQQHSKIELFNKIKSIDRISSNRCNQKRQT